MPYIKDKDKLEVGLTVDRAAFTPGELNYQFTILMTQYVKDHPGYQGINDVMGALEGAKLEFYRRFAAPYASWPNASA